MCFGMVDPQLPLPAELHNVPEHVLQGFLASFAQQVTAQAAPDASSDSVHAAYTSAFARLTGQGGHHLRFRHVCRHTACPSPTCQLCLNNPHKACHPTQCLDQQYWVRDDARGGQLVKAKCGADVVVQLFRGSDPQPLLQPDVQLKLYVIPAAAAAGEAPLPPLSDPVAGLHLSDEGRPLWVVPGVEPEQDGGLPLGLEQEVEGGPGWPLPAALQFLDKNSKFRAGGRRLEGFRLLVRALQPGPGGAGGGGLVVVAQAASTPFKVTTKKAYDSCRKVEYLYGGQPFTPTTLPHMGAASVNNLKAVFGGLDTVDDLVELVEAAGRHPPTQQQLREVLNMGRNDDKWAAFQHVLAAKVLVEDSTPRLWWLPSVSAAAAAATTGQQGAAPSREGWGGVGLVWSAHRGQVELDTPAGVVVRLPGSSSPLQAVRITPQEQEAAGAQLEQLQQLAVDSWQLPGHPGWRLVTQGLEWAGVDPQQVAAAADSALGGNPAPAERLAAAVAAPATSATSGGSVGVPAQPNNITHHLGGDQDTSSSGSPRNNDSMGNPMSCTPSPAAATAWQPASGQGTPTAAVLLPRPSVSLHASGGGSRRPPISPLLPSRNRRQGGGRPASLSPPPGSAWGGGRSQALASPAAPPYVTKVLGSSGAGLGAATSPLSPGWPAAGCVPGASSGDSWQQVLPSAKRSRPSLPPAAAVLAAPAAQPHQWWTAAGGQQPQPPHQQQVMLLCSGYPPAGVAGVAAGGMFYHPALMGAPTLQTQQPQQQQQGQGQMPMMAAPGGATQPYGGWHLREEDQQQAMGVVPQPVMPQLMPAPPQQQWGYGGIHLHPVPPPGLLEPWQWRFSARPEAMPTWQVSPTWYPGAAPAVGCSATMPTGQASLQLPWAPALPPLAGAPWLPARPVGDNSCGVSASHGVTWGQQVDGSCHVQVTSNAMPLAAPTYGGAPPPVQQGQVPAQELELVRQPLVAAGCVSSRNAAAATGGGGGDWVSEALIGPPAVAAVLAGGSARDCGPQLVQPEVVQGRGLAGGLLPDNTVDGMDEDMALMWHWMVTDQDLQQGMEGLLP